MTTLQLCSAAHTCPGSVSHWCRVQKIPLRLYRRSWPRQFFLCVPLWSGATVRHQSGWNQLGPIPVHYHNQICTGRHHLPSEGDKRLWCIVFPIPKQRIHVFGLKLEKKKPMIIRILYLQQAVVNSSYGMHQPRWLLQRSDIQCQSEAALHRFIKPPSDVTLATEC